MLKCSFVTDIQHSLSQSECISAIILFFKIFHIYFQQCCQQLLF